MHLDLLLFLQSGSGSAFSGLLVPVIILGIFFLLVILPQRKQQQKHQEMLDNLKSGDKVIALGGLIGTVMSVSTKDNTVQLQIAPSVRVEVVRNAITALQQEKSEK
ncbi:MAG TPA: preprotein translocase subunit YajC [Acidobacteriota bacterium]|nr:preprotein translocase subunit YajC [Acidobacteriota bacterium]HNJ41843.1 preprotein translocase subunit YajC [Acidobacteriota bacterium]